MTLLENFCCLALVVIPVAIVGRAFYDDDQHGKMVAALEQRFKRQENFPCSAVRSDAVRLLATRLLRGHHFHADGASPRRAKTDLFGRGARKIDHAPTDERTAVIDTDDDCLAVFLIHDAQLGTETVMTMCSGQMIWIHALSGSRARSQSVPRCVTATTL
jgi:hypothetical protein